MAMTSLRRYATLATASLASMVLNLRVISGPPLAAVEFGKSATIQLQNA